MTTHAVVDASPLGQEHSALKETHEPHSNTSRSDLNDIIKEGLAQLVQESKELIHLFKTHVAYEMEHNAHSTSRPASKNRPELRLQRHNVNVAVESLWNVMRTLLILIVQTLAERDVVFDINLHLEPVEKIISGLVSDKGFYTDHEYHFPLFVLRLLGSLKNCVVECTEKPDSLPTGMIKDSSIKIVTASVGGYHLQQKQSQKPPAPLHPSTQGHYATRQTGPRTQSRDESPSRIDLVGSPLSFGSMASAATYTAASPVPTTSPNSANTIIRSADVTLASPLKMESPRSVVGSISISPTAASPVKTLNVRDAAKHFEKIEAEIATSAGKMKKRGDKSPSYTLGSTMDDVLSTGDSHAPASGYGESTLDKKATLYRAATKKSPIAATIQAVQKPQVAKNEATPPQKTDIDEPFKEIDRDYYHTLEPTSVDCQLQEDQSFLSERRHSNVEDMEPCSVERISSPPSERSSQVTVSHRFGQSKSTTGISERQELPVHVAEMVSEMHGSQASIFEDSRRIIVLPSEKVASSVESLHAPKASILGTNLSEFSSQTPNHVHDKVSKLPEVHNTIVDGGQNSQIEPESHTKKSHPTSIKMNAIQQINADVFHPSSILGHAHVESTIADQSDTSDQDDADMLQQLVSLQSCEIFPTELKTIRRGDGSLSLSGSKPIHTSIDNANSLPVPSLDQHTITEPLDKNESTQIHSQDKVVLAHPVLTASSLLKHQMSGDGQLDTTIVRVGAEIHDSATSLGGNESESQIQTHASLTINTANHLKYDTTSAKATSIAVHVDDLGVSKTKGQMVSTVSASEIPTAMVGGLRDPISPAEAQDQRKKRQSRFLMVDFDVTKINLASDESRKELLELQSELFSTVASDTYIDTSIEDRSQDEADGTATDHVVVVLPSGTLPPQVNKTTKPLTSNRALNAWHSSSSVAHRSPTSPSKISDPHENLRLASQQLSKDRSSMRQSMMMGDFQIMNSFTNSFSIPIEMPDSTASETEYRCGSIIPLDVSATSGTGDSGGSQSPRRGANRVFNALTLAHDIYDENSPFQKHGFPNLLSPRAVSDGVAQYSGDDVIPPETCSIISKRDGHLDNDDGFIHGVGQTSKVSKNDGSSSDVQKDITKIPHTAEVSHVPSDTLQQSRHEAGLNTVPPLQMRDAGKSPTNMRGMSMFMRPITHDISLMSNLNRILDDCTARFDTADMAIAPNSDANPLPVNNTTPSSPLQASLNNSHIGSPGNYNRNENDNNVHSLLRAGTLDIISPEIPETLQINTTRLNTAPRKTDTLSQAEISHMRNISPESMDPQAFPHQKHSHLREEIQPLAGTVKRPQGIPDFDVDNDSIRMLIIPLNAMMDVCVIDISEPNQFGRNNSTGHPHFRAFGTLVVSRNHMEIYESDNHVYLRDIGSNSGTFKNHARISPPGVVSPEIEIYTGDYIQLGKDYVGDGTETDENGRISARRRCVQFQVVIIPPGVTITEAIERQRVPIDTPVPLVRKLRELPPAKTDQSKSYAQINDVTQNSGGAPGNNVLSGNFMPNSPLSSKKEPKANVMQLGSNENNSTGEFRSVRDLITEGTPILRSNLIRPKDERRENYIFSTTVAGVHVKKIEVASSLGVSLYDVNLKKWEEKGRVQISDLGLNSNNRVFEIIPIADKNGKMPVFGTKISPKITDIVFAVVLPTGVELGILDFSSGMKLTITRDCDKGKPDVPVVAVSGDFKEGRYILVKKTASSREQKLFGESKGKHLARKGVRESTWLTNVDIAETESTSLVISADNVPIKIKKLPFLDSIASLRLSQRTPVAVEGILGIARKFMNRSMSTHKNEALAAPIVPTQGSELATFGAGCFWGVEKSFNRKFAQNGLLAIQVGYIGGAKESPNYQAVCSGRTGYAEAVQLSYDPTVLPYEQIVDFFYRMHDPTTLNRQGGDAGTQYRSAIFVHNDAQKKIAQDQTQAAQVHFGSTKIMTTIEPASHFWPAEEYHQRYLDNNPHGYECAMHYERTWDRITALHK
ncbi:hypothetical protein BASA60_007174 [Batrachochytrium salamandrivorans]|nr:hypothetical protein BASA60_007174 [Batrachochytrium salamandrivorans]